MLILLVSSPRRDLPPEEECPALRELPIQLMSGPPAVVNLRGKEEEGGKLYKHSLRMEKKKNAENIHTHTQGIAFSNTRPKA